MRAKLVFDFTQLLHTNIFCIRASEKKQRKMEENDALLLSIFETHTSLNKTKKKIFESEREPRIVNF